MTPPTWYLEWANYHRMAFGLSEQEAKTVLAWSDRFLAQGYIGSELRKATNYLITHPQCLNSFSGKMVGHLAAIQARILADRAVITEQSYPGKSDRGECTKCGGSGYVTVPHWKGMVNGEWRPQWIARAAPTFYTMSVICDCALGNWLVNTGKTSRKNKQGEETQVMRLQEYQARFPRWQIEMAKKEQRQRAAHAAEYSDRPNSKEDTNRRDALEQVMDRIRRDFHLEKEEQHAL